MQPNSPDVGPNPLRWRTTGAASDGFGGITLLNAPGACSLSALLFGLGAGRAGRCSCGFHPEGRAIGARVRSGSDEDPGSDRARCLCQLRVDLASGGPDPTATSKLPRKESAWHRAVVTDVLPVVAQLAGDSEHSSIGPPCGAASMNIGPVPSSASADAAIGARSRSVASRRGRAAWRPESRRWRSTSSQRLAARRVLSTDRCARDAQLGGVGSRLPDYRCSRSEVEAGNRRAAGERSGSAIAPASVCARRSETRASMRTSCPGSRSGRS